MQKWEYITISQGIHKTTGAWYWIGSDNDSDVRSELERLNELGKEGWELVNVVTSTISGRIEIDFYFKRPME